MKVICYATSAEVFSYSNAARYLQDKPYTKERARRLGRVSHIPTLLIVRTVVQVVHPSASPA